MTGRKQPHLLVDVFAGPGGLGEGFLSRTDSKGSSRFKSALSVEKDEDAHATLTLRHFVRAFGAEFPEDYYSFLAGEMSLEDLYAAHPEEHASASGSARRITLGESSHAEVKKLLTTRLKDQTKWALVGGPPCQAYSLVGRSRMGGDPDFEQDERHFLYKEYLKIIADHLPPVFVMENVKGLLSATVEGVSMITRIVADLEDPSKALKGKSDGVTYRLFSLVEQDAPGGQVDPRMFIVRAEDYGVPQARHRMFIVGIRNDLIVRPSLLKRQDGPSVRDMIGDLPRIRSRLSRQPDNPDLWRAAVTSVRPAEIAKHLNGADYTRAVRSEIEVVTGPFADWPEDTSATAYAPGRPSNAVSLVRDPLLKVLDGHESRSHMASDLQRYLFAAVFADATGRSPKLADFPPSLLPAHGNVTKGVSGDMFADRFRVQLPQRASTTITSHISKDGHYFIHYDPLQCRSLTLREAARLQTFPDNYRFLGNRTSQYHQVGNAVPPHLAGQIADIVADVLDRVSEEP
ncbi:MAG: DNA (cytosine-5-)-methyltransferase [Devosia sp. 67-54]|uniref:DNA cytosine methyltransferase n=1 Tax=unclassified Devosia TaxID=196773 RepID=UPI0009686489|nr:MULTISPECIES: DNA (cytosine-5-)-methyltransferase [unclassified Devosia]MBN9304822.1 DNA cytosine methyltransferase [Devosia sp.]OJX15219.1 MAG: DNA (cytosine-5-)-methyltransferase [Devosia sp. 67-54]